MKTKITILLLALSLNAASQSIDDVHDILHLCFELAAMPAEAHLNDAGIAVLVITDKDVLPDELTLSWFGEPILQLSTEEIEAQNIEAFLVFESIYWNGLNASVSFLYFSSQPVQDLSFSFHKVNGTWSKTE